MNYSTRTERRSTVLAKKPNRNIWQCCQLLHPPPCIAWRHTRAETVSCEGNGSLLSWPMWGPDWSWVHADGSDRAVRERDFMLLGSAHAVPQDAGWRLWQSAARRLANFAMQMIHLKPNACTRPALPDARICMGFLLFARWNWSETLRNSDIQDQSLQRVAETRNWYETKKWFNFVLHTDLIFNCVKMIQFP